MQVSSVSKSFSFLKVLQIPTMENGPKIAKKFYEELMGVQVWFFSMILWHFTIIISKSYWVLVRVEIIHKSKFLPGTVEKNSSTIRSSSRNRTYACAMP